jgi:hypothetical protein
MTCMMRRAECEAVRGFFSYLALPSDLLSISGPPVARWRLQLALTNSAIFVPLADESQIPNQPIPTRLTSTPSAPRTVIFWARLQPFLHLFPSILADLPIETRRNHNPTNHAQPCLACSCFPDRSPSSPAGSRTIRHRGRPSRLRQGREMPNAPSTHAATN